MRAQFRCNGTAIFRSGRLLPQGRQGALKVLYLASVRRCGRNIKQLPRYGRVVDDVAGAPVWVSPRLTIIFTSTRRFCDRPSRVVLSATDSVFP